MNRFIVMAVAVGMLAAGAAARAVEKDAEKKITPSVVKIRFAAPEVRPDFGIPYQLPEDARHAGMVPNPDSMKNTRLVIQFWTVTEPRNQGGFNKHVGNIDTVSVTWRNTGIFKTEKATEEFLRKILAAPSEVSSTYTHRLPHGTTAPPDIICSIKHNRGKSGQWLIWHEGTQGHCAYKDGFGKWLFSYWTTEKLLGEIKSASAAEKKAIDWSARAALVIVPMARAEVERILPRWYPPSKPGKRQNELPTDLTGLNSRSHDLISESYQVSEDWVATVTYQNRDNKGIKGFSNENRVVGQVKVKKLK